MFSCYSVLACYNLFSGVKLSIRSGCFISVKGNNSYILNDFRFIALLCTSSLF